MTAHHTTSTLKDHLPITGRLTRPSTKETVELAALLTAQMDAVLLVFGGPWCQCGAPNKEALKAIYNDLQKNPGSVEFIFAQWRGVRPDIASIPESAWTEYMEDMPWLVLDAAQSASVSHLKSSYAPTFTAFCLDRKDETVAEVRTVDNLLRDFGATAFPFTKAREAQLQGFFDACVSGNVTDVRRCLELDPGFATRQTPREWHAYHIMRAGWQPAIDAEIVNPGVMNADRSLFLQANHPATGLHLAAGNGHTELIEVLLEANADIEAGDGEGDTALAWATWSARREAMDQLLIAGADPSFVDNVSKKQFEAVKGNGDSFEYVKKKRTATKHNY